MGDRHPDALTCGAACRRERARLLAILNRRDAGPYRSLRGYQGRRRNQARAVRETAADTKRDVGVLAGAQRGVQNAAVTPSHR